MRGNLRIEQSDGGSCDLQLSPHPTVTLVGGIHIEIRDLQRRQEVLQGLPVFDGVNTDIGIEEAHG